MRVLRDHIAPVLALFVDIVNEIIEDQALVGELEVHLAPLHAPPLGEEFAEVVGLVRAKRATKGPDGRKLEVGFVHVLVGALRHVLRGENALEDRAERGHHAEVHERCEVHPFVLAHVVKRGRHVLLHERLEPRLLLGVDVGVLGAQVVHPRLEVGSPAHVGLVEEEDSRTADGRG